ncbi:MAG: DUF58 domain-containing protein [Firmicutes bacterium]|nr:DUF58 domain-containing protein [Bacillota bacterium]
MLLDTGLMRLLEQIEVLTKKVQYSNMAGQKYSRRLGGGMEFSDYRQYQVGDDYRYIDWNLYSRLEQLFLKQFIEERDSLIYCLIDHSTSMGFGEPSKLAYALQLAAALGYIGLAKLDRVGAAFFTSTITKQLQPKKGKNWVQHYFRFLDHTRADGKTNVNQALGEFANVQRPGLAVIFSDFFDEGGYETGVLKLLKSGFEVWMIQVLSSQELLPSEDDDVLLIDSELGLAKEVYLCEEVIVQYRHRLEIYLHDMAEFAKRYQILYLTVSTETSLEAVIFDSLRKLRGVK